MSDIHKHNFLSIINFILLFLVSFPLFSQENFVEKRDMIVVIDAGHGGKDPGAMGPKGNEKDLVLEIALKLGNYIKENLKDVKVVYTRNTDVFVELFKRADIANKAKADLFISIHANSNKNSAAYGSETYVMGLGRSESNLAVAKKENSVILQEDNYKIQYEGFDPYSAEGKIIFSLYQNEFLNQSLFLASEIQNEFKDHVKRYDRGVKQEVFWVLYKTVMPSILIELGFISNIEEATFLFSEEGKENMASAIYRAFKKYKAENYDKRHTSISIIKNDSTTTTKTDTSKINNNNIKINRAFYSIQISSAKETVATTPSNFKGLKNVFEYTENKSFKYFYGKETDIGKIKELYKLAKEKFPDCFLVSFIDGKKGTVAEAKKIIANEK